MRRVLFAGVYRTHACSIFMNNFELLLATTSMNFLLTCNVLFLLIHFVFKPCNGLLLG